jgi:hypothetical protein
VPGYKFGTGISNSLTAGSLQFTGEEALDAAFSVAGAAGRLSLFARSVQEWWNLGSEGDALFKSLSLGDKLYYEIGKRTLSPGAFSAVEGLSAIEAGRNLVAERGFLSAMFGYGPSTVAAFGSTLSSGPTAAFRLYLGPTYGSAWWATNVGTSLSRP